MISQSTVAPPKQGKKLLYIDALRGIAILGVVAVHCSQYGKDMPTMHPTLASVIGNGARGVQLFFVASAFTLFLSMSNRGKRPEQHPTRNFFIRRLFRIAPMYWLGVLFYSWWLFFKKTHSPAPCSQWRG